MVSSLTPVVGIERPLDRMGIRSSGRAFREQRREIGMSIGRTHEYGSFEGKRSGRKMFFPFLITISGASRLR